jgi:hypothetical protein
MYRYIWNTLAFWHKEQDRQCIYNVTMMRLREIIVVVEKQYVLHILSVCVCVCVWT